MEPTAPITRLKGVGPSLAGKLGNLGIARIGDLLLHLPMRYQDRSRLVPMSALNDIDECLIEGRVLNSKITYGKRRSWLVTIEDDTGFVTLRFFYFSRQQQAGLHNGMTVRAFGSPRPGPAGMEMVHPEYQASSGALPPPTAQLTPLYHTTKGIGQGQLRRLLTTALALDFSVASAGDWPLDTLRYLHNPPATASLADITAAAQRIAMDELTAYYLVMQHRQSERKAHLTLALPQKAQLGRTLLRNLGFQLTGAQRRATTEVLDDLSHGGTHAASGAGRRRQRQNGCRRLCRDSCGGTRRANGPHGAYGNPGGTTFREFHQLVATVGYRGGVAHRQA